MPLDEHGRIKFKGDYRETIQRKCTTKERLFSIDFLEIAMTLKEVHRT